VASNNTMDLFEEMRFAVLAQRGRLRDSQAMSARKGVEMATVGGALALGLEREVGALTPGMSADVIAVNLDALATTPCYDPYSALVYTCGARDIRLTVAHGVVVYDDGAYPTMDADAAGARFNASVGKMRAAGGVS